jgi:hypothetical protein
MEEAFRRAAPPTSRLRLPLVPPPGGPLTDTRRAGSPVDTDDEVMDIVWGVTAPRSTQPVVLEDVPDVSGMALNPMTFDQAIAGRASVHASDSSLILRSSAISGNTPTSGIRSGATPPWPSSGIRAAANPSLFTLGQTPTPPQQPPGLLEEAVWAARRAEALAMAAMANQRRRPLVPLLVASVAVAAAGAGIAWFLSGGEHDQGAKLASSRAAASTGAGALAIPPAAAVTTAPKLAAPAAPAAAAVPAGPSAQVAAAPPAVPATTPAVAPIGTAAPVGVASAAAPASGAASPKAPAGGVAIAAGGVALAPAPALVRPTVTPVKREVAAIAPSQAGAADEERNPDRARRRLGVRVKREAAGERGARERSDAEKEIVATLGESIEGAGSPTATDEEVTTSKSGGDQDGERGRPQPVPGPVEPQAAEPSRTRQGMFRSKGSIIVPASRVQRESGSVRPIRFPPEERPPRQITAKLCIDARGVVTSVTVLSEVSPKIRRAVEYALSQWRYRPVVEGSEKVAACFATVFPVQVD